MKVLFTTIFFIILTCPLLASDFDFYRQSGGERSGPTLLVIGGIDGGDEPGGFHAAATLITHYQIQRGHLWIVPNLNVAAIIKRQRGGKMNLKFASLAKSDSYYDEVSAIKEIITNPPDRSGSESARW